MDTEVQECVCSSTKEVGAVKQSTALNDCESMATNRRHVRCGRGEAHAECGRGWHDCSPSTLADSIAGSFETMPEK